MRARVASGGVDLEAIEKARDALDDWLLSELDESTAEVFTAEELDLRRALKMEA